MHKRELVVMGDYLRREYPGAFCEPPMPLDIGIKYELRCVTSTMISKRQLDRVLAWWTGRPEYLRALVAGERRRNLDGVLGDVPVGAAREAARRGQCTNNLKEIGIAMQSFHNVQQTLPNMSFCGGGCEDTNPGMQNIFYRFRHYPVAFELLPYLEQGNFYDKFNLNLAATSTGTPGVEGGPTNAQLASSPMSGFSSAPRSSAVRSYSPSTASRSLP